MYNNRAGHIFLLSKGHLPSHYGGESTPQPPRRNRQYSREDGLTPRQKSEFSREPAPVPCCAGAILHESRAVRCLSSSSPLPQPEPREKYQSPTENHLRDRAPKGTTHVMEPDERDRHQLDKHHTVGENERQRKIVDQKRLRCEACRRERWQHP